MPSSAAVAFSVERPRCLIINDDGQLLPEAPEAQELVSKIPGSGPKNGIFMMSRIAEVGSQSL